MKPLSQEQKYMHAIVCMHVFLFLTSLPYNCFTVNSLICCKRRLYNIDFSHLLKGSL